MLLRENICQLWGFNRGEFIFLRPQCPITRTYLRQRETESYNTLNCSNNKTIYGNGLFCHNKWVAKRQGHRNLEFHIVHLLEPAPQTQTATAHLQTTWTVYFDGQGTQKLPCGKIPPPGGGEGGIGWLMVYRREPVHCTDTICFTGQRCYTSAFENCHEWKWTHRKCCTYSTDPADTDYS